MKSRKELIGEAFRTAGLSLSEQQADALEAYAELLVSWNEKMNLTAITDAEGIAYKHFADSCALLYELPEIALSGKTMIDVGTGAGFPGLPLKILCPELKLTLLDSLAKRLTFLDEVIKVLGLREVETVHARAEDGARKTFLREHYDFAVSRAVANLSTLSEYCLPYVKCGGCFIAYKSGDIGQELADAGRAIRLLGGDKPKAKLYTLPGTDMARSLVVIGKKDRTPDFYPRKAGTAAQKPL